jgi:ankyrin repeat protein
VLLKEGADVNAVTKLRGSPLHAAALLSSPAMVNVLLEG